MVVVVSSSSDVATRSVAHQQPTSSHQASPTLARRCRSWSRSCRTSSSSA